MVKIISLNTRGLANEKKRRSMFKSCRDRADIVWFQECHSTKEREDIWISEWVIRYCFHMVQMKLEESCILEYKVINKYADGEGGIIIVELSVEGNIIVLCNLYAPNLDKPDFFRKIIDVLKLFPKTKL